MSQAVGPPQHLECPIYHHMQGTDSDNTYTHQEHAPCSQLGTPQLIERDMYEISIFKLIGTKPYIITVQIKNGF